MPALDYGMMAYEELDVLSWSDGRTEATSYNMMAETENGWYLLYASWLWYADKSDPNHWVILCSKPECNHMTSDCSGNVSSNGFIIKDQRIYYIGVPDDVPQYNSNKSGRVILSVSLNGNDRKMEYIEDALMLSGGGSVADYLLPDQWLVASSALDSAGNIVTKAFRITPENSELFFTAKNGPEFISISGAKNTFTLYGDKYFFCNFLDNTGSRIYRFQDEVLIHKDVEGLPLRGGYISENVLRCFRTNDGYYDIDLSNGQETRLSDPQLNDSYSAIILPNCIVESTLLYPISTASRTNGMSHKIVIFNGVDWQNVTLPAELEHAANSFYITVQAVTSEGILLACRDSNTVYKTTGTVFYYINLAEEELTAEYWTEIILPKSDT